MTPASWTLAEDRRRASDVHARIRERLVVASAAAGADGDGDGRAAFRAREDRRRTTDEALALVRTRGGAGVGGRRRRARLASATERRRVARLADELFVLDGAPARARREPTPAARAPRARGLALGHLHDARDAPREPRWAVLLDERGGLELLFVLASAIACGRARREV